MLRKLGQLSGIALWICAAALFGASLYRGSINIIGPLILIVAGLWLFRGPQKILAASRARKARYENFLASNPEQKKLELWSKWLGWGALPIAFLWMYFALDKMSDVLSTVEIAASVFVLFLPGLILSFIPIWKKYRQERERFVKRNPQ